MQRFHEARRQLQASDSREGVSQSLQTLIDQLMPSELNGIPPEALAAMRVEPDLVPGAALDLTRTELAFQGDPEPAALLRDIANVYVLASNRIAAIDAKARLFTDP